MLLFNHKIVPMIVVLTLFVSACSSKIITQSKQKTNADISTTDGSKMILFVENENLMASEKELNAHKEMVKNLYQQFGGVTTSLPMFTTTGKIFEFGTKKKFWVIDANKMEKRTAIILFDGKNKPIIEYKSEKYPDLINKYFAQDILDKNKALKAKEEKYSEYKNRFDSLISIPFYPNKKYAESIINNGGGSVFYQMKIKCDGLIRSITYKDSELTSAKRLSETYYRKGRFIRSLTKLLDENLVSETICHFSEKNNLLDSVSYLDNGKIKSSIYFKYLPDRYIFWYSNNSIIEEIVLNKKLQATKRIVYNKNNIVTETYCEYDQHGRLTSETFFSKGEKEKTMIYEYNLPNDTSYSKLTITTFPDKNIYESTFSTEKDGKKILTSKANGVLQHKSISEYSGDCNSVTTSYNAQRKVTSVYVVEKIE